MARTYGPENYITLFATDLPKYFGNTLILWIIGFIPQIAISLLLAAWFTDLRLKLKGQTFFKRYIYMPNLIMASAFAMLFFALFSDNGPVNAVLPEHGLDRCTHQLFEHRVGQPRADWPG